MNVANEKKRNKYDSDIFFADPEVISKVRLLRLFAVRLFESRLNCTFIRDSSVIANISYLSNKKNYALLKSRKQATLRETVIAY